MYRSFFHEIFIKNICQNIICFLQYISCVKKRDERRQLDEKPKKFMNCNGDGSIK